MSTSPTDAETALLRTDAKAGYASIPVGAQADHSHSHGHGNGGGHGQAADTFARREKEKKVLLGALLFCLFFMVIEFAAGVIAHSLALLTDAIHLLTDVGAYALSIAALFAAGRAACSKYNFGWHRAEVIGTLISIFSIWALVGWIVIEAFSRIYDIVLCSREPAAQARRAAEGRTTRAPATGGKSSAWLGGGGGEDVKDDGRQCRNIESRLMIVVGFLGMLVNVICASILYFGGSHGHSHFGGAHDHGHSHGGGHSGDDDDDSDDSHHHGHSHSHGEGEEDDSSSSHGHSHSHGGTKKSSGFAIQSALLHALGDCVQSLGVILAGVYIYVANNHSYGVHSYRYSIHNLADPLASIFFAVVTLNMTRHLLMNLFGILMESTPNGVDYPALEQALLGVAGVVSVHDLHVWSLSSDYYALSAHIVAEDHRRVLQEAQDICSRRFHITHTTIQIDSPEDLLCAGACAAPNKCLPGDH